MAGIWLHGYYYILNDDESIDFPDPLKLSDDIAAVGGMITVERLLSAYQNGIFPWYDETLPVLWQSPQKRFVLPLQELHIGKSIQKWMRKKIYRVTCDTCFSEVIYKCRDVSRPNQVGTWITPEIIAGYCELFKEGYAHSVECWLGDNLIGGLYGVSLGNYFFGESMFSLLDNASKTAFVALTEKMPQLHLDMIDCQVYTENMARYGAREVSRENFVTKLRDDLKKNATCRGTWSCYFL